jgi:hypothetical protein
MFLQFITQGIRRVASLASVTLAGALLSGTAGATTMAPTAQGWGQDDWNISTIFPNSYQTYCSWVLNGLSTAGFTPANGWNFAFAGFGPAAAIPNIPASDFTIDYYKAWVVTHDPIPGNVTSGNRASGTDAIKNQDAGGADFVLTYAPRPNTSDPAAVHFIQAFVETQTGANPIKNTTGKLDAPPNSPTPYYDLFSTGGAIGTSTWMRDIPYACESGRAFARIGCDPDPARDEFILSRSDTFQTFVVSANTVDLSASGGSPYTHILYGGEQWGYTYTNSDTAPEPSFGLLMGGVLLAFICVKRRKRSILQPPQIQTLLYFLTELAAFPICFSAGRARHR